MSSGCDDDDDDLLLLAALLFVDAGDRESATAPEPDPRAHLRGAATRVLSPTVGAMMADTINYEAFRKQYRVTVQMFRWIAGVIQADIVYPYEQDVTLFAAPCLRALLRFFTIASTSCFGCETMLAIHTPQVSRWSDLYCERRRAACCVPRPPCVRA
jgi:hypothetical protein